VELDSSQFGKTWQTYEKIDNWYRKAIETTDLDNEDQEN
jgi:hypothetical protein